MFFLRNPLRRESPGRFKVVVEIVNGCRLFPKSFFLAIVQAVLCDVTDLPHIMAVIVQGNLCLQFQRPPSRAERKIHPPVSACVPLVPQNTPECNYDGGDCCSCTCEDTPNQECGRWGGFACIDPSAACVDDDDITVDMLDVCDYVGGIG